MGQVKARAFDDMESLLADGTRYGCIYCDPPWPYTNQATRGSTDNHYVTMSMDDIRALPVESLAADDAHLHLWTTNGFLGEAIQLVSDWGFTYKSFYVWVKPQMGMGNYWRVSHEVLLLGVRGRAKFRRHDLMSWGEFHRGVHSSKPEAVRLLVESASPGPYLELFARRTSPGWTSWGNEVERGLYDDVGV